MIISTYGNAPTLSAQVIYSGAGISIPTTFLGSTFGSPRVIRGLVDGYDQFISSVSIADNTLRLTYGDPQPSRWETVTITSTGVIPSPLQAGVRYYVRNSTTGTYNYFQLSATLTGAIIDITSTGTGSIAVQAYLSDLGAPPIVGRSLDSACPTWATINTSDGVYDWSKIDNYIDYHFKQRGRQTLICLNQVPSWATNNQALDAYGQPGGGQVPTDLTKAAAFITELLLRYNKTSSFNPQGLKMIYGIEAWNEPSFMPPGTSSQNWCGTMDQLVIQTKYLYNAVKAADSTCIVLSPGFTYGLSVATPSSTGVSMYRWLTTSDGSGGFGKSWIDGVCYHGYGIGDTSSSIYTIASYIQIIKDNVVAAGLPADTPLYQTERGMASNAGGLVAIKTMAIEAAMGIQLSVHYSWDGYTINPRSDSVLLNGFTSLYNAICGKQLTYCAITQSGSVIVTANGVTTTWTNDRVFVSPT